MNIRPIETESKYKYGMARWVYLDSSVFGVNVVRSHASIVRSDSLPPGILDEETWVGF